MQILIKNKPSSRCAAGQVLEEIFATEISWNSAEGAIGGFSHGHEVIVRIDRCQEMKRNTSIIQLRCTSMYCWTPFTYHCKLSLTVFVLYYITASCVLAGQRRRSRRAMRCCTSCRLQTMEKISDDLIDSTIKAEVSKTINGIEWIVSAIYT
ncbi:hypothetical protein B0I72DRAFT_142122 [Yarrowia lipolytica]|uniref:Uncharacterized protein n=1 Tax=Yarrowia lipolytica TaxID=4952 RepID=A0A371C5Y8_YARLL|nr:hypothetical protein B0I71DRAFT_132175 [Yarrowia lipolytica]RDW30086.1 hypothetical protein B0I72DRAFT_142122 [Yarrowia lipolytica]RDW41741.1 hypothetical protein B0I73DRAFT_128207 [Yarrowia lipolytica]